MKPYDRRSTEERIELEAMMGASVFVPTKHVIRIDRKSHVGLFHTIFSSTHVLPKINAEIFDNLNDSITLAGVDRLAKARRVSRSSLRAFVSYLVRNNLLVPAGCGSEAAYVRNVQERYKEKSLREPRSLRHVYLMLTSNCNLSCRYCIVRSKQYLSQVKRRVMTTSLAKSAIDFLCRKSFFQDDGGIALDFFGGEPLLEKELLRNCAEYIQLHSHTRKLFWSKPNRMALSTNGWLIDDEFVELCRRHRIGVSASLDGFEREQGMMRPNRNPSAKYRELISRFHKLERAGVMNGFAVCISKGNLDRMPDFIRWLAKTFSTRSILLSHLKASSNPCALEQSVSPAGHKEKYDEIYAAVKETGFEAADYQSFYDSLKKAKPRYCCCGVNGAAALIDPDGYAYPCPGLVGSKERVRFDPAGDFTCSALYRKWSMVTPWTISSCFKKCGIFSVCGGKCAAHHLAMKNHESAQLDLWCDVNKDLFHRALSNFVDDIWNETE